MNKNDIVAYENWLLKNEVIIRLAFVVDLVVLAGAVIVYALHKTSIAGILLPVIVASGLYALLNRAELKHIATIKRYRELDQTKHQHGDTPNPHSPSAPGADSCCVGSNMRIKLMAMASIVCILGCTTNSGDQVAVVLGKYIYRDDLKPETSMLAMKQANLSPADFMAWQSAYPAKRLAQLVQEPLMRRYMREHKLAVSDKELIAHLKHGDEPVPDEVLDKEGRAFFQSIIETRLFAKSLFQTYGGRVAISSFGFADAVDARAAFLRQQAQAGAFVIQDSGFQEAFWRNATNEWLDVTLTEEKAREMFSRPGFPMEKE